MHSYLLLVSSSKGSFGEESLEIGSLPLIWGRGTHGKDQISLAETGDVLSWFGRRKGEARGLSKVYGRGDSSGKPPKQHSTSAFGNSGAIGKGVMYRPGRGGAVIGCFHIGHF